MTPEPTGSPPLVGRHWYRLGGSDRCYLQTLIPSAMLNYLNANQGAIMAVLTLVYVAATLFLVMFALKQARLTQQSLAQFKEAEQRRYRPNVVFDILCEDTVAYAVIKNTGASPALKVTIEIEPKLQWDAQEKKGPEFVEGGIAFLAPGREVSEPFSAGEAFHHGYKQHAFVFRGSVTYTDAAGGLYTEPFHIDIAYTQTMSKIGEPEMADELKRIREALQRIASDDFHPLVRVVDQKEYPAVREAERQRRAGASFRALQAAVTAAGVPPASPSGTDSVVKPPAGTS